MGRTLLLALLGSSVFFFAACHNGSMTATATPLPIRYVLLNLSQSNGTTVADAKGFEDANPQIAMRNPVGAALATTISQGSGRDEIVIPDPEFGTYRTVNYRGKGLTSVRYLTFFNPTSLSLQRTGAAVAMPTYPGEVEVGDVVNGTTFQTKMVWHADPSGKVELTRKLTGKVYTIASATVIPGVELTMTESFSPPLQSGERFAHKILAAINSASTSVVTFYNQYGGLHDLGGTFEESLDGLSADYPNATMGSYGVSVWEVSFTSGTPGIITSIEHPLRVGRKVRFAQRTGTLPVEINTTTDYYITRVVGNDCYISATPEGAELGLTATAGDFQIGFMPDGRDSTLAGLNLRCVSGTNAGEVRPLGDITENGTQWDVNLKEAFTSPPQQDDVFEIEAPDLNGTSVPFDQWAYFLPACQLSGREQGLPAKNPVTITTGGTTTFLASDANYPGSPAVPFYNGCPVKFYRKVFSNAAGAASGQAWPTGITEGTTYYVVNQNTDTGVFQVSATYDGTPITLSGTTAQIHWIAMAETWLTLDNPAPPGFNYNNIGSVPVTYQPYRGATQGIIPSQVQPKIAYHYGWAQRLSERLGEDIYVINIAVGGSTLAAAALPAGGFETGVGWYDQASMTHWAKGDSGLRQRLITTLDAAEIAAEREGVQLRVIAVGQVQGESDAATEDRASRYLANRISFAKFVRDELKRRGMWDGEAETLPWMQPNIRSSTTGGFPYATEVNKAIDKAANGDPFSRTWVVDKYPLIDAIHYDGVGMDMLAKDAFTNTVPFLEKDDSVLRICKLALRLAGESAEITSIYPPDAGSAEAEMCAAFYPEAREHMLDRHAWDFLVRTELLEEASANGRDDWNHAYALPLNLRGVIGLGHDEMSTYDSKALKIKHSIELNTQSERVLYANQPTPLYIRYKTLTVDQSKFDAAFINACAAYMASLIVRSSMKGEEGIKAGEALERRAYEMFKSAAVVDSNNTRDTSQSQRMGWRR